MAKLPHKGNAGHTQLSSSGTINTRAIAPRKQTARPTPRKVDASLVLWRSSRISSRKSFNCCSIKRCASLMIPVTREVTLGSASVRRSLAMTLAPCCAGDQVAYPETDQQGGEGIAANEVGQFVTDAAE